MTQDQPSLLLNIGLAAGVALALALGAGVALFYRHADLASLPAAAPDQPGTGGAVFVPIPARPAPVAPQPAPPAPANDTAPVNPAAASPAPDAPSPAPAASSETSAAPDAAAAPSNQPFEPPAPAIEPADVAPAAAPTHATDDDSPIVVKQGDPLPALRTVELEEHDVHKVPDRDQPTRTVTVLNRQGKVIAVERGHGPTKATAENDDGAAPQDTALAKLGTKLSGEAIVTGTLELNIGGRPLRLFGLKPPEAADLCAPGPNFAARACADVSRFALATHLERNDRVTCRVLAVGGRSALPAVCSDDRGTDLGSYLVAQGLALADSNDMVDYSGVEKQAQVAGLGLWHYRE